jgi:hypothetical protein
MTKTNTLFLPLEAKEAIENEFSTSHPINKEIGLHIEPSRLNSSIVVTITYQPEFESLVLFRLFHAGFNYAKPNL